MSTGAKIGAVGGGVAGGVIGGFIGGPLGAVQGAMYGATIGAGIGGIIDPLKPDMGSPDLQELAFPQSQEGIPVPDLLGTTQLTGNITYLYQDWSYTEYTVGSYGGGSKQQGRQASRTRDYMLTFDIVLCLGIIEKIQCIYVEEKILKRANATADGIVTISTYDANGYNYMDSERGYIKFFFGNSSHHNSGALTGSDCTLYNNNFCWARFTQFNVGTQLRVPSLKFVVTKRPSVTFWGMSSTYHSIGTYSYNPVSAIYYLLTNYCGYTESDLDQTTFSSALTSVYNNFATADGLGINMILDSVSEVSNYIDNLLFHIDGVLYQNSSGKLCLKLLREEAASLSITSADLLDIPEFSQPDLLMPVTSTIVTFPELKVYADDESVIDPGKTIQLTTPMPQRLKLVKGSNGSLYTVLNTAYGTYLENTKYQLMRSTDSGTTWAYVSDIYSGPTLQLRQLDYTVDRNGDYIHFTWVDETNRKIKHCWCKVNDSTHAYGTVAEWDVSSVYTIQDVGPSIAVDSTGVIYVYYVGARLYEDGSYISQARYWSGNDVLGWTEYWTTVYDAYMKNIAVAIDGGDQRHTVFEMYKSSSSTLMGIWYTNTFFGYTPVLISNPDAVNDQHRPRIAVDSPGNSHITWYGKTQDSDENHKVWYRCINTSNSGSQHYLVAIDGEDSDICIDQDYDPYIVWSGAVTGYAYYRKYTVITANPPFLRSEGSYTIRESSSVIAATTCYPGVLYSNYFGGNSNNKLQCVVWDGASSWATSSVYVYYEATL